MLLLCYIFEKATVSIRDFFKQPYILNCSLFVILFLVIVALYL